MLQDSAIAQHRPIRQSLLPAALFALKKIYGGGHINRQWYEAARQEIKDGIHRDDDAYVIATLYAASGYEEKAMDLLERGYDQHDRDLFQLKVDPRLDNVRSSPRFQALLRRMNFPD